MIRVFPHRTTWTPTDELSFVGHPGLFRPAEDLPVMISVVFSWDVPLALKLQEAWSVYYSDVKVGGPAFGDPGGDFVPGRFIKDGVTITSRGCSRHCPWCYVPGREGKIRELEIKPGHIVQDNNLLACSKDHIIRVFEMLMDQKGVKFSGGLDTRLLRMWQMKYFDALSIKELWFACDTKGMLNQLETAAGFFEHYQAWKKRCYVMIGFEGETLAAAEKRLEAVFEMGFFPFCQLYQGDQKNKYNQDWRTLQKKWSRPAFYNREERDA
jgi:hypothetical protein